MMFPSHPVPFKRKRMPIQFNRNMGAGVAIASLHIAISFASNCYGCSLEPQECVNTDCMQLRNTTTCMPDQLI